MFLEINLESEIPIYTQIRNGIIKGIALGELVEGDGLPSVRQMAADMGINMHTINKGYNLLKQEGFLSIHRRKGVVVNSVDKYQYNPKYLEQLKMELEPLVVEAITRGLSQEAVNAMVNDIAITISGGQHG